MAKANALPQYRLWGVSHKTSPLSVRELWALNEEEKRDALKLLRGRTGENQVVVLGTCNRTEFYFYGPAEPTLSSLNAVLREVKGGEGEADPSFFYFKSGGEAVSHLFSVAGGLDSQILGETEIQGQVRRDLALAREAGTCRDELGRLFEHALKVGKRIRTETRLSEGVLSAGQAGVLLAAKVLGDLSAREVLLIGTGKIGTLTARSLLAHGVGKLRVTSRTEGNARRLAELLSAETVPFAELAAAVARSDLVISSTAAPGHIVEYDALAPLVRSRSDRALVVIDLAVPRDFDPRTAEIENVFLHDLDDLEAVLAESRSKRLGELPLCEFIVEEETRKFITRQTFRTEIEPLVARLIREADSLWAEEVAKRAADLSPEARRAVEEVARKVARRVLLFPVKRLKDLRNRGDLTPEQMALIRTIFEVETDDTPSSGNAR